MANSTNGTDAANTTTNSTGQAGFNATDSGLQNNTIAPPPENTTDNNTGNNSNSPPVNNTGGNTTVNATAYTQCRVLFAGNYAQLACF